MTRTKRVISAMAAGSQLVALALFALCAAPVNVALAAPRATLRVCTANIRNTPDMPDRQVRADVRTAAARCDLILWQEIGEKADYQAVVEETGKTWQTTRRAAHGGVPVSWRRKLLTPAASSSRSDRVSRPTSRCPDGSPSYNPARYITIVPLRVRATGLTLSVIDLQFPQRRGCRNQDRAAQWRDAFNQTKAALPAGALLVGGDWNRRETEIHPMTRQHWITPAPNGLDHLFVARTGARVVRKLSHSLHSDHDLRGAQLCLGAA